MSAASARRAARLADALLQSTALLGACRHRRWRLRALAMANLARVEAGVPGDRFAGELAGAMHGRALERLLAGGFAPAVLFEHRLDAIAALADTRTELDRAEVILARGDAEVRARYLAEQPLIARRLDERMVLSKPGTREPPRFVGQLDRPGDADRYPDSTALAFACAGRCTNGDRPDLVRRAVEIGEPAAIALAHYLSRGADALPITRQIRQDSRRDRALHRLALAALARGNDPDLHRFTAALEGAKARDTGALLRGLAELRRNRIRAARRELGRIRHPHCVGRRDELLGVCTLARELRVEVPASPPTLEGRARSLRLLLKLRSMLRDPEPWAWLTSWADRHLLAALAAELHGAGLTDAELYDAGQRGSRRALSIWAAALFELRLRRAWRGDDAIDTTRLDALDRSLAGDGPPTDPVARATYDEAQVLAEQIRSPLALCRAASIATSLEVVKSRARALSLVGGARAARALVKLIGRCEIPEGIRAALGALLLIDPSGALEHILAAADPEALRAAEVMGALEDGFANRWCATWASARRLRLTAELTAAIEVYRQRHGRLPPVELLEPLLAVLCGPPVATWSASIDRALSRPTPDAVAETLAADRDLLFRALWLRGPVLPRSAGDWTIERTHATVIAARASRLGSPRIGTAVRFARIAGGRARSEALVRALWRGASPGPAEIEVGRKLHLRYLDKRAHILEFLRMPDAYPCCFSSTSDYYTCDCHSTRDDLLRLWRDPLSFGFLIEEQRSSRRESRGFVFGSYGVARGAPVALLNGIYMQGQSGKRRIRVCRALERYFAGFGVHRLAIANEFGGCGALPADYAQAPLLVERLRALVDRNNEMHRRTYDDIGGPLNAPSYFPDLRWSPRLRGARRRRESDRTRPLR